MYRGCVLAAAAPGSIPLYGHFPHFFSKPSAVLSIKAQKPKNKFSIEQILKIISRFSYCVSFVFFVFFNSVPDLESGLFLTVYGQTVSKQTMTISGVDYKQNTACTF